VRWFYFFIGIVFVAVGFVGIVVPGLPTTPFLLISLWAFARSSERFHNWLYNHPWVGPGLRRFVENRVIPPMVKATAISFMSVAVLVSILTSQSPLTIGIIAAVCVVGAAYVLSCPSRAA
jgi:uncharacterized membrane protein YbaN (DUF454 family)